MEVVNAVTPPAAQALAFFAAEDDGPFVMINLLKFKQRAEYEDGRDPRLSGRDAYARYGAGVQACLAAVGGRQIYAGAVTELLVGEVGELWDMVALAEYPSRLAMMTMLRSREYRAIEVHRHAGLEGQLNIRTKCIAGRPRGS